MNTTTKIMSILALWCGCATVTHAGEAGYVSDPNDGNSSKGAVTVELTKLEVTDSALALTYSVRNGLNRDIWVCSEVSSIPFEVFLRHDKQTLLIRKRVDVPSNITWRRPPTPGTYVRLSPGDSRPESLRIDLPVCPQFVYTNHDQTTVAQTLRRLTLEIGYYDEDLPALVRSIFEVADRFSPGVSTPDPNMLNTYFRGLAVRGALSGFDVINKEPYNQGQVYIDYSYQALTGEKVLRMEINGLAIPYNGDAERESTLYYPMISR
jgi:hypothetical protein